MSQIENELLDFCINNARDLFKEMEGEFYPFGCVHTNEGKPIPFYNTVEEEFPSSIDVLNSLILTLYLDVTNSKYIGAAICALATKKIDATTYEFLDIKILLNDGTQKDYCVIIYPDSITHSFENEEPMVFEGTFKESALKLIL